MRRSIQFNFLLNAHWIVLYWANQMSASSDFYLDIHRIFKLYTLSFKIPGTEDECGASGSKTGCSSRHTDSSYSNSNIPTSLPPSQQSFLVIPAPAGWWETMNLYLTCCHSFLPSTHSPVYPCLPSAALPLAVGKWTKAPLNRPMHSFKARGLDLSWRGETQFISAPDQLPAKRTSHPISRRLQHKKQEWGWGWG